MAGHSHEDGLIAELQAGMLEDSSDLESAFTAQLEAWFKLNYEKESVRVEYQRMVAIGKNVNQNVNLKPVIERFGRVKDELVIIESLMTDLCKTETNPEVIDKLLSNSHYYPPNGVAFKAPESLKKRLEAVINQ